jgi:hypothetical protein
MLGLGPEGDGRSPADSGGDARVAEFLLLIDGVPVTSLDGLFLFVTMLSAFLAFIHTIDSSQIADVSIFKELTIFNAIGRNVE